MTLEQTVAEILAKMKSNNGSHALYILWLEDALAAHNGEYYGD
jgi:hypothetical protein